MKKILKISFIILLVILIFETGVYFAYQSVSIDEDLAESTLCSQKLVLPISESTSTESARRAGIRVPILVYHSILPYYPGESAIQKVFDVEPDHFAAQLQYLKNHGYTVISFDDLINFFNGKTLPSKPVIITFDDGWENQYTYALPLLEKEHLTATFFIYSNAIGHRSFLSWDQVRALSRAGMSIGGHSKTHPYLWKITDPTQLRKEIIDSKKIIESQIGKTLTVFAYPFGRYSTDTIDVVKKAGYRAARGGYAGSRNTKKDLFTLRSLQIGNDLKNFAAIMGR